MPFAPTSCKRSSAHYRDYRQVVDEVLYAIAQPHAGVGHVGLTATLLVSGRSYATGSERQRSNLQTTMTLRVVVALNEGRHEQHQA